MNGICSTNYEIIHRIQILHESIAKSILISHDAFTRIEELQTQLTVLQRQCVGRDRALCETLKIKSLDETNIIGKLIKVVKLYVYPNYINAFLLSTSYKRIRYCTRC